jgi:hypothetical protein
MTVKQTQPDTERLNLTEKVVEGLRVPTEKRTTHYDTQVRGLGVLVQPTTRLPSASIRTSKVGGMRTDRGRKRWGVSLPNLPICANIFSPMTESFAALPMFT